MHAHLDVLCEFLSERLQGNLDFFVELTFGFEHVDSSLAWKRYFGHSDELILDLKKGKKGIKWTNIKVVRSHSF